jgi:hypothetical protein
MDDGNRQTATTRLAVPEHVDVPIVFHLLSACEAAGHGVLLLCFFYHQSPIRLASDVDHEKELLAEFFQFVLTAANGTGRRSFIHSTFF